MQNKSSRLWLIAFLLGWLFDFLVWDKSNGIQFALFVTLTLSAGFIFLWLDGVRPARFVLPLIVLIAAFTIITLVRSEPLTVLLAHGFTLFFMAGTAITYTGGRWMEYSFSDYLSKAFQFIGSEIALPLQFNALVAKQRAESGATASKNQWLPVLRGLLFAIPILMIFSSLLSSADAIFAERMEKFFDIFNIENFDEYIFRIIYISIIAYLIVGAILHAATKSGDEKLVGEDKPLIAPFVGFTEASIVMGSLAILFGAFVVIQFQYFFGGNANIRIDGYTYAEYARRGFGELNTVAFFTLLLFQTLSVVIKRESEKQNTIFSTLGAILILFVGVMLVSAYQRLALYEAAYGFTQSRTYAHVFMIWLALLLLAAFVLDVLRRSRYFAFASLCAAVGFALSLALLNVDGFIVRQNVAHAFLVDAGSNGRAETKVDVGYLASLSNDAVPVLVEMFNSAKVDDLTHDGIGAALACINQNQELTRADYRPDWREFSLTEYRARQSMFVVLDSLDAYQFSDSEVRTPLGKTYSCWSYGWAD